MRFPAGAFKTRATALMALALCCSLNAAAQPASKPDLTGQSSVAEQNAGAMQGLGLSLGYHSDYKRATIAYETPSLWGHQFNNEWGRLDLYLDLGLSYWDPKQSRAKTMGQLSAIPTVRWWPREGIFVELGSGPTLLSRSEFAGRNLSTRFQFGSRIGVGFLTKSGHQLGLRYAHFSNASIKKPNPGLDVLELAYSFRF